MPIPTSINDLSTNPASNSPSGSDPPTEGDNHLRALAAIIRQEHDAIVGATAGTAGQGAGAIFYNTAATYATATVGAWLTDFSDSTSAAKGDARIAQKRTFTGASASTWHAWLEKQPYQAIEGGCLFDNSTDDTTAFQAVLDAADDTVNGAQGNKVLLPHGTAIVDTAFNIPNRVSIHGLSKRGSVLKADSGHAGSYMFTADNGTSSMFDNGLHDLTLDCNDVAGLGGVLSDAWQEGGGLHNVLINKFRTYGVRFQNGDGGAALCEIAQSEIFGSAASAATAGIRVDQISLTGNFMLKVRDTTIAGGDSGTKLPRGIDVVNDSLHGQNVHFENCTTGIYLDGVGEHVLIGVTGGPGVTNVVEIASTFTGSLTMLGCHRASATNLLLDNRTGGLGTIGSEDPGFVRIDSRPARHAGAVVACANLNGVAVNITSGFGITSIARHSGVPAGDYDVTITTTLQSADDLIVTVGHNLAGGRITKDVLGTSSFRVRTYDSSGALTDANEISAIVTRVK